MIKYETKADCHGCTACKSICPKNTISMNADEEGFLYPLVNEQSCIKCSLCVKVCPMKKVKIINNGNDINKQKFFAAKNLNSEIVMSSSSGGVFSSLSNYILDKKGSIYGATYDSGFRIVHNRAVDKTSRDQFRGSKYVQSDMLSIYKMIEDDLKKGLYVMFSGTPCQNAGVISYIDLKKINKEKLYTCDFVCHGVSSPLIWEKYITYIQDHYKDKLVEFSFRNKMNGWKNPNISLKLQNTIVKEKTYKKHSYLDLYKTSLITRPSCYQCRYTNFNRVSDISLGDFWNIEHTNPEFYDKDGVSLVITNNIKGLEWFNEITNKIDFIESNKKAAWQPHLEYPINSPKLRQKFWDEYHGKGFQFIIQKYCKGTVTSKIIKLLTPIIKKIGLYTLAGKLYKKLFNKS